MVFYEKLQWIFNRFQLFFCYMKDALNVILFIIIYSFFITIVLDPDV